MSINAEAIRTTLKTHAEPDPDTVSYLPKGGTKLAFVGHAEITRILLEVDPEWTWEPQAWDPGGGPLVVTRGKSLVLWGALTLHGKRMVCVGTCETTKAEADKELIGDLLRNGAMRFGISLNLWSKADKANAAVEAAIGHATSAAQPAISPPIQHSAAAVEVMADALDCADPVGNPPNGHVIEDWHWFLAEKSQAGLDALKWETVAKDIGMKVPDLMDRAKGLAKEADLAEPERPADIHGQLAVELRRFLLSQDEPF